MTYITPTDLPNYLTGIDFSAYTTPELQVLLDVAQDMIDLHTKRAFGPGTFTERGKAAQRKNGDYIIPLNHFKALSDPSDTLDNLVLFKEATATPYVVDLSTALHRKFPQWIELFSHSTHCNTTYEVTFTTTAAIPGTVKYALALIVSNMLLADQQSSATGGSTGSTTTVANLVTSFRSGKYAETRKDPGGSSAAPSGGSTPADTFMTPEILNMLSRYALVSNDVSVF